MIKFIKKERSDYYMEEAVRILRSPIGNVVVKATAKGVSEAYFSDEGIERESEGNAILNACLLQLEEYFNGARREFSVPLDLRGTEFRLGVWRALLQIPYGKTSSYGRIAATIGKPKASRAVGGANHNNPVSIIVPCHRVVGSDGGLTGYGGGLDRKRWLLDHEAKYRERTK
jgi:methylated-DNA-[protein]-cysteine S-methyltransferase